MRRIACRMALGAALAGAGLAGGCSTVGRTGPAVAAPGANGVSAGRTYVNGKASQAFALAPAEVQKAARLAMVEDLRFQPPRQTDDPDGVTTFEARTPDGRHALISIHPNRASTLVTAKVGRLGLFNDEAGAQAVMDRIAIRLGAQAAAPPPKELPTSDPISRRFSKDAVPDEVMFSNQIREASSYRDSPVP